MKLGCAWPAPGWHSRTEPTSSGPLQQRVTVGGYEPAQREPEDDILGLNEALNRLEELDATKCNVVTLRFLLGCSVDETAAAL